MLLNLNNIIQKYGKPTGILHIGAHMLEERNIYINNNITNIIWVEANPNIFNKILPYKSKTENFYNYIICDVDDETKSLFVTNNGQSSSILELNVHKLHYPEICVTETVNVPTKTLDTLIEENNINLQDFNFLNIDIQGAELLALKGFTKHIHKLKYIYIEINTNTLYKDCSLVNEIDTFLLNFNFKRVETAMTPHEWGEALYIKQ